MTSERHLARVAPAIIGFGGSALTGKSRLSQNVAQALTWPRASFGDYVRALAARRGLGADRSSLQSIGEQLIEADAEGFCRAVLAAASWRPGQPAVLDGVRHASVLEILRRIATPQPVLLVLVTAHTSVRTRRLAERRAMSELATEAETIAQIDMHSTERDVHTILSSAADLVVETGENGDDHTQEVLCWLTTRLPGR